MISKNYWTYLEKKNDDDSEQDKDTIWRKTYERSKEIPLK